MPDLEVVKEIIEAAASVAAMTNSWGNLPVSLKSQFGEVKSRQVTWKELLSRIPQAIQRTALNRKKFARRHIHTGAYLPRMEQKRLNHITVAFDTSGSVSDHQINLMLGELNHLRTTLNPKETLVLCFDTQIHTTFSFTDSEPVANIDINGRGGTYLEPIPKYIDDQDIHTSCLIVFSDMDCAPLKQQPEYPIFWIILDNPGVKPPFGDAAYFDSTKY